MQKQIPSSSLVSALACHAAEPDSIELRSIQFSDFFSLLSIVHGLSSVMFLKLNAPNSLN